MTVFMHFRPLVTADHHPGMGSGPDWAPLIVIVAVSVVVGVVFGEIVWRRMRLPGSTSCHIHHTSRRPRIGGPPVTQGVGHPARNEALQRPRITASGRERHCSQPDPLRCTWALSRPAAATTGGHLGSSRRRPRRARPGRTMIPWNRSAPGVARLPFPAYTGPRPGGTAPLTAPGRRPRTAPRGA